MRGILLLAMLAVSTRSERWARQDARDRLQSRTIAPARPAPSPTFEFAPAAGTGMGTACAGTAITGSNREVVTTARNGTGYCLKGNTTTSIAVGDLVAIGNNLPRVMPGLDGTGALGVLVEQSMVESVLQTEALDTAITWVSTEAVTADAALAPDNTLTADQLNDTSAIAQSCTSQVIVTASATKHTVSAFVRAGTIAKAQLTLVGTGNGAGDCSASITTLSGSTWDRITCTSPAAYTGALTAVTVSLCVGTVVDDVGTVMGFGVNHVVNATFMSSYIKATTVAVTRAVDTTSIAVTVPASTTTYTLAATYQVPSSTATQRVATLFYASTDFYRNYLATPTLVSGNVVLVASAGPSTPFSVGTANAGAENRIVNYYDGAKLGSCLNGSCGTTTGALTMLSGAGNIQLGYSQTPGTSPGNGVIKKVCFDTNYPSASCL